jgi:c-di-GMP-related signal transduction protein
VLNSSTPLIPEFFAEYRAENITKRLRVILDELNDFFDHKKHHQSNIKSLTRMRIAKLLTQTISSKLRKKYFSGIFKG